jgi:mono/diheme cytochrome c family protein
VDTEVAPHIPIFTDELELTQLARSISATGQPARLDQPYGLASLVAYVLAASHFGPIDDDAASAGHDVAYRFGCFGCHGPEGRGLVMNPGSFKGYIPPWDGADFADLVRDDAELRQWIETGACDRLRANPIARRFLESQAIAMPAYRGRIKDEELRALAAYIARVRAHPRTGAAPAASP